jgi:hypothetical protein
MMNRVFSVERSLGAVICVLALATPVVAGDADILAVGTFSSPQGDQGVEDTAVTIWFTVRTQNGPINVSMTGTADGDTMKGSLDSGGRGQGQWSAKRSAVAPTSVQAGESKVDVTGTWSFQVETGAGTGTPTMTFKQEGEKLSGHYSGQLGEAPISGTIKGNAIEFAFDVSVQGTAVHVVYSGTVEKDSMKGTVKLGDFGDGTFTAKKKS